MPVLCWRNTTPWPLLSSVTILLYCESQPGRFRHALDSSHHRSTMDSRRADSAHCECIKKSRLHTAHVARFRPLTSVDIRILVDSASSSHCTLCSTSVSRVCRYSESPHIVDVRELRLGLAADSAKSPLTIQMRTPSHNPQKDVSASCSSSNDLFMCSTASSHSSHYYCARKIFAVSERIMVQLSHSRRENKMNE